MATVVISVGSRSIDNVTVNSVAGSDPWTLTLSAAAPATTVVGDTIEMTLVDPEPNHTGLYLITAISGDRLSLTVIDIGEADGEPPEAVSATTQRAYSGIGAAEADILRLDLSPGDTWEVRLYNDALISEAPVTFNDVTVAPSGRFLITVPPSERHNGVIGAGTRWSQNASGRAFYYNPSIGNSFQFDLEWLEIVGIVSTAFTAGVQVNSSSTVGAKFRNLIIHGYSTSASSSHSLYILYLNGDNIDVFNCLLYDFTRGASATNTIRAIYALSGADALRVFNTTIRGGGAGNSGVRTNVTTGALTLVQNVAAFNCDTAAFQFGSGSGWHASSGNNCTDEVSAPGSNNQVSKVAANQFVDLTGGSEDYHLLVGADCINNGADLSSIFTDDIDGHARMTPWDIGADGVPLVATVAPVSRFVGTGVHRRVS